jgi:23S rRNA-/tRNA-specific pseudouridylate synthase
VKPDEPTIAAVVRQQTGVAWSRARGLCMEGRVTVNGERCLDPASRVRRARWWPSATPNSYRSTGRSAIVFCDRDVVVVDKPVGMLSVADEPGNKDTLVDTPNVAAPDGRAWRRRQARRRSRLDRDTSGLMMFARRRKPTNAGRAVPRPHHRSRHHAIAHGAVTATRVELSCWIVATE